MGHTRAYPKQVPNFAMVYKIHSGNHLIMGAGQTSSGIMSSRENGAPGTSMGRKQSNPSPAGERRHRPHRGARRLVDEAVCGVRGSLFIPYHARRRVPPEVGDRVAWRHLRGTERGLQFALAIRRSSGF